MVQALGLGLHQLEELNQAHTACCVGQSLGLGWVWGSKSLTFPSWGLLFPQLII